MYKTFPVIINKKKIKWNYNTVADLTNLKKMPC